MAEAVLWTFQDAVERLLDNFGEMSRDGRNFRMAKEAVINAYNILPKVHAWRYYIRKHRFATTANYKTGTVIYDHTGNANGERVFVLTGGTWPTDAAQGYVRVSTNHWAISSRISATVLQVREDQNPGADIAATAYEWYRDAYPFPVRTRRTGALVDTLNGTELVYVSPDAAERISRSIGTGGSSRPSWYTVRGDDRYMNSLAFVFAPPPTAALGYEYIEEASGQQLTTEKLATGTATIGASSTTLTVSSAVLTSAHVGCVVRLGTSTTEEPTSLRGGLPVAGVAPVTYKYQRIITAVPTTTTATLDAVTGEALTSVKYTISSPIDIENGSMLEAFWGLCEWEFSKRSPKANAEQVQRFRSQYLEDLLFAQDADRRSTQVQSAQESGSDAFELPIGTVTTGYPYP